jgi:MFS family permease
VRPFGALVFGRIGDIVGRKNTFLVTMAIMGLATFLVGLLPTYEDIGVAAPIILIGLRLLQGLALGGEYGGAATYVAEHAPANRRGLYTSWIQTTATLGLLLSLVVLIVTRQMMTPEEFDSLGWRIPFLLSAVLLGVSLWIRLKLSESPVFQRMKEEGATSKAPLAEAFARWGNLKLVLIALFGAVAGQAVVWYAGQFYALFFLQRVLKVDGLTTNLLIAASFHSVRVAERQNRTQADYPCRLPSGGPHLFSLVQSAHQRRQSSAGASAGGRAGYSPRGSGQLFAAIRPDRTREIRLAFLRYRKIPPRQGRRQL